MDTKRNPGTPPETVLVSVRGVADMLGFSNTALAQRAIDRGEMKAEKVGAFYRVDPNDALALKELWRDSERRGGVVERSRG